MQHPEHPSVQSHREGILLCTEAQKDALAARLFFFLARSISNALCNSLHAPCEHYQHAVAQSCGTMWDDFYYGKLNRCTFNDSPGHDCIFI